MSVCELVYKEGNGQESEMSYCYYTLVFDIFTLLT